MLDKDTHEALNRAKDSAVDDDRPDQLVVTVHKLQVCGEMGQQGKETLRTESKESRREMGATLTETDGQVEVQLNRRALETTLQRIADVDVDLGAVEGTITRVQLPRAARSVQGRLKSLLSSVPDLRFAQVLLGARAELHLKVEAEHTVDVVEEGNGTIDLLLNVVRGTEDVRVVLGAG